MQVGPLSFGQHENDPADVSHTRIAPQVHGAALNDDVAGLAQLDHTVIELEFDCAGQDNAVVDAAERDSTVVSLARKIH